MLACGLFIFAAYRYCPYHVYLTDAFIAHDIKNSEMLFVRFTDVDRCEIAVTRVGRKELPALILIGKLGDRKVIGLTPSLSVPGLVSVLESRGLRVVTGGL